jgi:hypothetical protein
MGDDDSTGIVEKPFQAFHRFRFLGSVHTHSFSIGKDKARTLAFPPVVDRERHLPFAATPVPGVKPSNRIHPILASRPVCAGSVY